MYFKGYFVLLVCVGVFFVANAQEMNDAPKESVVNSNNIFTGDLYQKILETKKFGSFVVSPFSLSSVLTMLKAGAIGNTAAELSRGLQLQNISDEMVHEGYSDLIFQLHNDTNGVVIETGNKIYTAEKFDIKESYLDILRQKYYSEAEKTNFAESKEAAEKINRFVANATHDKITDIVDAGSLDGNTIAVLVNTIYFKGLWQTPFNTELTTQRNFTTLQGDSTLLYMMKRSDELYYSKIESLNSQVVSIPYKEERFSLIVVLPAENKSISEVESLLTSSTLAELPSQLRLTNVKLWMPKFKMETEIDFVDTKILQNLGMKQMLTPSAEFSVITDAKGIYINKVLQKAFIEINEEGTEAAAATVGIPQRISLPKFETMEVNRPFIAYIFDELTKAVIFVVRKTD